MATKKGPYLIIQATTLPRLSDLVNEEMEQTVRIPIGGPILVGGRLAQAMVIVPIPLTRDVFAPGGTHDRDEIKQEPLYLDGKGTDYIVEGNDIVPDKISSGTITTSYGVLPEEELNDGKLPTRKS